MYVLRNSEVRSCNKFCSGRAVSIAYSECVFVDLGIQRKKLTDGWADCSALQVRRQGWDTGYPRSHRRNKAC